MGMFVPTSVKRPHWVLLGRVGPLKRPGVQQHTVHGKRLISFVDDRAELQVMDEACPHRGASLAGGTVQDASVECPYHRLACSSATHPARSYDYAAIQGLVWLDYAKDLITQHVMPPYYPEFSSKEYRTFGYSRTLDVNPVLYLENLLDWVHAETVHGVKTKPIVTVSRTGPDGSATLAYDTPLGPLTVENEYRVPFTASLRFRFGDSTVMLVMFSLQPTSRSSTRLHVHIARSIAQWPAADWLFRVVTEAPVWADERLVGSIDPSGWPRNFLNSSDELAVAYREAMGRHYPDALAYFIYSNSA